MRYNVLSEELQEDLEEKVSELEELVDAEIKVSVYDIHDGLKADVNGDKTGWAASIIKVPILAVASHELSKGKLELKTKFRVNHKFTLEDYDFTSRLPEGSQVDIYSLLYHMIVESDNEATNMIINSLGIEKINEDFWELGLNKTMLGHLLCPDVPRYTSDFNEDGSNITCTNDMIKIMRHIYDRKFSKLDLDTRLVSDIVMSFTGPSILGQGKFKKKNIKSKEGYIFDINDGRDTHEVGIIENHLIVSIMMNKVGQNSYREFEPSWKDNLFDFLFLDPYFSQESYLLEDTKSSPFRAYKEIMKILGRYID